MPPVIFEYLEMTSQVFLLNCILFIKVHVKYRKNHGSLNLFLSSLCFFCVA